MKRIYLDYAATTPLEPWVARAMEPFFAKNFGNPSSIHAEGVAAKRAVAEARLKVARALEARAEEIVFTSGGTEANNLAIFGVLSPLIKGALPSAAGGLSQPPKAAPFGKGDIPHIVATNIEHASVLEPLRELGRRGRAEVTYAPVEPNGIVKPEKIIAAIKPNTVLVSVMYANNEIGTIQPIRTISRLLTRFDLKSGKRPHLARKPLFHVDACQAPLYLRCLVNALGADLLSLDAHKIYGPKGVGALYIRRGAPIAPELRGGGQESGLRSTTENVPAIVGFAEALCFAVAEREKESVRLRRLRNELHSDILKNVRMSLGVILNGSMEEGERLPNNLNLSFPGVDTEMLLLQLDAAGIAVSTKSSCLRDERESSVVRALGGGAARARRTLRFTLGRWTTKEETRYAAKILGTLLNREH
ncbi:MAG: cysteine desulfurase family protein [Patescibacteria group bacterium]